MKSTRVLLLLFLVATGVGTAQVFPEFVEWMKTADKYSGALRKMERKTGPEAVRAAEELGGVYEEMIGFWRQRPAANAVKISEEGKAAAVILASAAKAGDAAKADEAFQTLGRTCRSCHDAFREKAADGTYRIKQP
jgi:cytochrome c553